MAIIKFAGSTFSDATVVRKKGEEGVIVEIADWTPEKMRQAINAYESVVPTGARFLIPRTRENTVWFIIPDEFAEYTIE